jgi:hypothetical protein
MADTASPEPPDPDGPDRLGTPARADDGQRSNPVLEIGAAVGTGLLAVGVSAITKQPTEFVFATGSIAASGGFLVGQLVQALRNRQTSRRAATPLENQLRLGVVIWVTAFAELLVPGDAFWREVGSGRIASWLAKLGGFADSARSIGDVTLQLALSALATMLDRVDSFPVEKADQRELVHLLHQIVDATIEAAQPVHHILRPVGRGRENRKIRQRIMDLVSTFARNEKP